jgi:hypothetical protein
MKKFSTHLQPSEAASSFTVQGLSAPKKQTLAFLRQFARVYHPIAAMPGIILN